MKIIWVATFGGNYNSNKISGTGGWVAPAETALICNAPNIELGIIFLHPTDSEPVRQGNVTYFPICKKIDPLYLKFIKRVFGKEKKEEEAIVEKMANICNAYNPDIVQVWGCENFYARIINYVSKPVLIHIQGLASSVINHYIPLQFSIDDLSKADGFVDSKILHRGHLQRYNEFKMKVDSELSISKKCKYWIGRTDWDKKSILSMNPDAKYFHCDEFLREDFLASRWKYHYNGHLVIQSTISNSWYKGVDSILKTAQVLCRNKEIFEWNVCGISASSSMVKRMQKKLGIVATKVHVNFLGSHPANIITEKLLTCDVYVHPSHIENSSNAICEAMALGVPVIAEYVGGNPTVLINDSGLLVQPYDPYCMAQAIINMKIEKTANLYSEKSYEIANKRHNKDNIVKDLLSIYKQIIDIDVKDYE